MLILCLLALVHLNRRGPGTLRLVCDLNLSLSDLNSRCGVLVLALPIIFLLVRDGRQPLARAVLLVAFRHAHASAIKVMVLGEHALRPVQITIPASDCHRRVVSQFALLHHLLDLRWAGPCHIKLGGHHVPRHFERLWRLGQVGLHCVAVCLAVIIVHQKLGLAVAHGRGDHVVRASVQLGLSVR